MRAVPQPLRAFLSAFDPAVGRLFLAARECVFAAAPDANELIYDAYNPVTCAYSFTGRLKEGFLHIAAYSGHVNLGFDRGVELADPAAILLGSGARIRHVRIGSPADLRSAPLRSLVRAAVAQGRALAPAGAARSGSAVRPTPGPKRRPKPRARR